MKGLGWFVTTCRTRWLLAAALALAACGGGSGGNSGGGQPPAPPPFADTAAAYWVAGGGSRWSYHLVDQRPGANPTPTLKTVTDAGETTVAGQTAHRFDHSWSLFEPASETEYRRFDGRSIHAVSDIASDLGVPPALTDYEEVPAPLVDGQTKTVVDQGMQIDLDEDGRPDTLQIRVNATTARVASLSVPAGDFTDVLRVRQDIIVTVQIAGTNMSVSATAVLTTWYARGVGIIRRVYEDPSVTAANNTVTEELVGLEAGGQRAGLVPASVALDGIGWGNDSGTPPATDFATGGGRLMALAVASDGNVEAAIRESDGVLVWRGTVLAAPAPFRFGAAAVAFDGTDFRVVAARSIPFNSPTEYVLVEQRVGPDGTLRDGSEGIVLDSGIPDRSNTLASLRAAARDGMLAVTWGRYDTTYVTVGEGLVMQRGYVIEGRVFGLDQQPVAPRFEFGSGLPAAIGVRQDRFIVSNTSSNGSVTQLMAWAVGASDGLPVSTNGQIVSASDGNKGNAHLQNVGDELWLSYAEWSNSGSPPVPALNVARLDRDGALIAGSLRTILDADANRGFGLVGLGTDDGLLAWGEGWGNLLATAFAPAVLTGGAALRASGVPLVPADPSAAAGPSRSMLWTGALGNALVVAWLDNEQSGSATPSDRLMYAQLLPRLMQPQP